MKIDIRTLHAKRCNVAFAFSTKDRLEFTKQTLPRVLEEQGEFDVYWIDGSTDHMAATYAKNLDGGLDGRLTEVHTGVGGGAATAITYSLQHLFQRGYDYIGLIENDVMLEVGWFKRLMDLFKTPQMKVGAASVRCFTHRILVPGDGFALMADVGAGMVLFKREVVPHVAINWRTPALWELQALCKHFTGIDYPIPPTVLQQDPKLEQHWSLTHDWFWPIILWSQGYMTLACTPSMAFNLDDPNGVRDPVQTKMTVEIENLPRLLH